MTSRGPCQPTLSYVQAGKILQTKNNLYSYKLLIESTNVHRIEKSCYTGQLYKRKLVSWYHLYKIERISVKLRSQWHLFPPARSASKGHFHTHHKLAQLYLCVSLWKAEFWKSFFFTWLHKYESPICSPKWKTMVCIHRIIRKSLKQLSTLKISFHIFSEQGRTVQF